MLLGFYIKALTKRRRLFVKKIVSACMVIAMLLSVALLPINIYAASAPKTVTVSTQTDFTKAIMNSVDGQVIQLSGILNLDANFLWPKVDTTITVRGGGLDFSKDQGVHISSNVTFEDVDFIFFIPQDDQKDEQTIMFANGNSVTMGEGVTMNRPITIYGGTDGGTFKGNTNLVLLSGDYLEAYGGNREGRIEGNSYLYVGGNVNSDIDWTDDSEVVRSLYGGGSNYANIVTGNTSLVVEGNAKAHYAFGGSADTSSKIGGYSSLTFGGNATVKWLFGASDGSNTYSDALLMMTGGKCEMAFGGSWRANLGSDADPSHVYLRMFGGEVTRSIYGGCFNRCDETANYGTEKFYVVGDISLMLGKDMNISFSHSNMADDLGVFARTRHSTLSNKETGSVIYMGEAAKTAQQGKLGKYAASANVMGSLTAYDGTPHIFSYTATENTVTESCSCGCKHSAKATLKVNSVAQAYTGKPIECAVMSFDANWKGAKFLDAPITPQSYQNNVEEGINTASVEASLMGNTLTARFSILKLSDAVMGGTGGAIEVSYTTADSYVVNIPPQIVLGDKDQEIDCTLGVSELLLPWRNEIAISVTSKNSYTVINENQDTVTYKMIYSGGEITSGNTDKIRLMDVDWNVEEDTLETIKFARTGEEASVGAYTDTLTFITEILPLDELLPIADGAIAFTTENYDIGDTSRMFIAKGVTAADTFETYVRDLRSAGYDLHDKNTIGTNHFATMANDYEILNVMYIDHYDEIRVSIDDRAVFSLPVSQEQNVYSKLADYTPNLTLISDSKIEWPGRMGYIYQLDDGSFFVIDGGFTQGTNGTNGELSSTGIGGTGTANSSAPFMMEIFDKYAPDPNNIIISGWLITHMHEDHFGAFIDLGLWSGLKEEKERITIEQLIYSASSDENTAKAKYPDADVQTPWTQLFKLSITGWGDRIKQKVKAHPGQKFYFHNLTCTVYTAEDLLHFRSEFDPFKGGKYINNTSIVTMVNFMGEDALYLADSSGENNPYVLAPVYQHALKADILQVAHHGYGDTAAGTTYAFVKPDIVFWPVYAQHFYGKDIGFSDSRGPYGGVKDVGFNLQLFEKGVIHYVHASKNITIEDFETYIPIEIKDELSVFDRDTWVPDPNYMKNNNYK